MTVPVHSTTPAGAPQECSTPFIKLVRQRYSCRRYDPTRAVARETLLHCAEAARMAPSACNNQPCRFVIVDAPDVLEEIRRTCRLAGVPHPWWDTVPVFVALCVELSLITHRIAPAISGIPYYLIDAGIAGEHFVLAATEQGLGTCWIGWFKERAVKKALGLPRGTRVVSLLTLGYPDPAGAQPPTEASRLELDKTTFWNRDYTAHKA